MFENSDGEVYGNGSLWSKLLPADLIISCPYLTSAVLSSKLPILSCFRSQRVTKGKCEGMRQATEQSN